jgi:tetratricopeptide (TPR) repeat protein
MNLKKLSFLLVLLLLLPGITNSQEKIDVLILNRNYDEALELLDKRIQKQPEASLYLKKGLVMNLMQNYQEAIKAFSSGLELEQGNIEIIIEIADAYAALGNAHEANPYYEQAVEIDPSNLSLAAKLGRNYIQLNDFDKAYTIFSYVYTIDSTRVYWNKQYAFSAYQTGKLQQATQLFEKVIEMNPGDYSSYINLVKLYGLSKQQAQKLRVLELGLERFPHDADLFNLQANHYFGIKQYNDARIAFENYFSAKGDSAYKTLLNYGVSLYFSQQEQKAISILEICAGQIANDPYVLFYLSLSHKKLAQFELAEAYMNAAIESATPYYVPDMYHHLGQIYGQQRKFEESIAALKKANELDPENYEILFEIATTYEEYNSNKTLALNYYNIYLKEAGEAAHNARYALDRMTKIKEDLFFGE